MASQKLKIVQKIDFCENYLEKRKRKNIYLINNSITLNYHKFSVSACSKSKSPDRTHAVSRAVRFWIQSNRGDDRRSRPFHLAGSS